MSRQRVGILFHELAHQVVYRKGDSTFNESFASAVEQEGIRRWFLHKNDADKIQAYANTEQQDRQFRQLLLHTREELKKIYASLQSDAEKQLQKKQAFMQLKNNYQKLQSCWGEDVYQDWICPECEPFVIRIGDQLHMEPGNMVGPTNAGLQCLIDMDPTAQWDPATGTVMNSAYATSPRIIKAPVFDPTLGVQVCHGVDCLTVTKIIVLFVEEHTGDAVVGRFMRLASEGVPDPDCSAGGFMYTVNLIE